MLLYYFNIKASKSYKDTCLNRRHPWEHQQKASKNGARNMANKVKGHRGGRSGPVITCPWFSPMASSDVKCYIISFTVNTGYEEYSILEALKKPLSKPEG